MNHEIVTANQINLSQGPVLQTPNNPDKPKSTTPNQDAAACTCAEKNCDCYCNRDIDEAAFSKITTVTVFCGKGRKEFLDALNKKMNDHGIKECIVKAHLLAHMMIESEYFTRTEERQYPCDKDGNPLKAKKGETAVEKRERYAKAVDMCWDIYKGDTKDRHIFHGRGYIHLTHDYNYKKYLGTTTDDKKIEEVRTDLETAVDVACWFWEKQRWIKEKTVKDKKGKVEKKPPVTLTSCAQKNDIKATTKGVNGGLNGFNDRKDALEKIGRALKIECCKTYSSIWEEWLKKREEQRAAARRARAKAKAKKSAKASKPVKPVKK